MSTTPSPSDEELLRKVIDSRIARVHVSMPGQVVAYDHTEQKATVQPIPRGRYLDENEDAQVYRFEPIANVPVMFPSATGYAITFPLTVGDQGMIEFAERSIDEWLNTGEGDTTPQDFRRFDLTDARFFPGTRSFANAIAATGIDAAALVVEAASIKLGSSAAAHHATFGDVNDNNWGLLALTMLTTWVPVPGDGGASLKAALAAMSAATGWPNTTEATKVEVE